jgi:GNAT superfamily N-acetyltransferase
MDFTLDPPLTRELREEIVTLWTDVSNAGGAVGFAGAVGRDEVWPLAARAFAGVDEGYDHLLVEQAEGGLAGLLFFVSHRFALAEHWRTVQRLMVHPALQGRGHGAALVREAAATARRLGWEALHLTVRDGTGLERFYIANGYREVGRLPGALRVGPGDDRDETHLWLDL